MKLNQLSRREREIMDVLFELGDEASAEEIREKLSNTPSYSAVRAMLAKLEVKGVVRHKEKGLKYVYSPTTSRAVARKSALKRLVQVFFGGSPEQAAAALLDDEQWSDDDLDQLAKTIERVKQERSK
jgi:BlaI family penicillinase repressor